MHFTRPAILNPKIALFKEMRIFSSIGNTMILQKSFRNAKSLVESVLGEEHLEEFNLNIRHNGSKQLQRRYGSRDDRQRLFLYCVRFTVSELYLFWVRVSIVADSARPV